LTNIVTVVMTELNDQAVRSMRSDRSRRDATSAASDGYRFTDAGNADRLAALHGQNLRYVDSWGKWIVWDGRRWQLDPKERRAVAMARDVPRHLFGLVADTPPNARHQLVEFGNKSESARALRAMVDVTASTPELLVHHDVLDRDGWLLNAHNGTLDLRTMTLHNHEPSDLITMLAGAAYHPTATAPRFEAFVERILPDPDIRSYVQSRLGAAVIGEVLDHELHIAWGEGANGKSTLFKIVGAVLGDYAVGVPKSLIVQARHEQHPSDRTVLFRRRLAYAGELRDGARLDEALVKELTGGDLIVARRMREDFWSFDPTHHLWLFSNHLPRVTGTDHAMWRRLRVVPFTVTIPDDEQDWSLARTVVESEADGILVWLLDGLQLWRDGREPPAPIVNASTNYRHGQDLAQRFIDEELVLDRNAHIAASCLWDLHADWCSAIGLTPLQISGEVQRVARALTIAGCKQRRVSTAGTKNRIWHGVRDRNGPGWTGDAA
jgi:putative DNA primase/helicase